ncbi:ComF family protein [Paradevosia shaoguanensis]|uniref:ComF family protein n=1 Tax=Paradevosia shaoguanensis TaxID=1335043 RepID=UPI003C770D5E
MDSAPGLVKVFAAATVLRRGATMLLDQLYPPTCLACQRPVSQAHTLCPECFAQLRPISAPYCPVLGIPFAVDLGKGALSAEAIADPPPFDRARAALVYNDAARRIVSRLKYGDHPELARFCARLMASAGRDLWDGNPVLVPVPLHFTRRIERRYNQSEELARALGKLLHLDCDPHLARRQRRTRQQVGLSGDQRRRNVSGAFSAHPDLLARLRGRRVVVVDDVLTTGSTVNALTNALRRAGVHQIDVMTFARVVIGLDLPI